MFITHTYVHIFSVRLTFILTRELNFCPVEPAYTTSNGTRKVTNGVSKSPANSGMEEDGSVGSTGSVTDSTGTQDEEEENRTLAMTEM